MQKILFVVDEKRMGGVSIVLEDILKNIDKTNKEIDLLVLQNDGECFADLRDINIIYGSKFFDLVAMDLGLILKSRKISKILKKLYLIFLLKTGLIKHKIRRERKKILTKKYDAEVAFKDGICTVFVAYGDADLKACWLHTDYTQADPGENYPTTFKKVFDNMDVIVGISNDVLKKFNDKYHRENKTMLIYDYIDTDRIYKSLDDKEYLDLTKTNLVSIGRLHPSKGYDRLINVMGQLKKEGYINDTILTIVGEGSERELIESLIKMHGLEEQVILVGNQMNPYNYIKDGDLYIMSSRYEGYALVVVEALILNIPLLAVEYSTIHEIIENEEVLSIVENSEEGLYTGLKRLLLDKKEIKRMKKGFLNYEYSTNDSMVKIEQLLNRKTELSDESNEETS